MQLEVLAPAKNLEQGKLAIDCGADAVYIGASKFGARAAVGNSIADITALVKHAHRYYAKVYIALNTILYDHELEAAEKLIHQIYETGADALIIQDMGILEMNLPAGLPLHASTQTHIADPDKARFLENQGFERLILARELSLEEIRAIRAATTIELEHFVHGALCVSYSGQCYLSQSICQRSGNRGECCQACRNAYDLQDATGRTLLRNTHLLSLRDLNLSAQLNQLIGAGITSFKIEGRLKDADYIKNTVTYYRKEMDRILAGSANRQHRAASSGIVKTSLLPRPEETFNRSYTTYFIDSQRRPMATLNTAGYMGTQIGTVKQIARDHIVLAFGIQGNKSADTILANGDGLCCIDNQGNVHGSNVNKVTGDKIYLQNTSGFFFGAHVYRNHNHRYHKELEQAKIERKIGVDLYIENKNNVLILHARDEDGNHTKVQIDAELQVTKDIEQNRQAQDKLLARTGDSIFEKRKMDIECSDVSSVFIPASAINQARRQVLEQLEITRLENYPKITISNLKRNAENYPFGEKITYLGNVTNRLAKQFYQRRGVKEIENALELQNQSNYSGKVVMTTRHCIKYEIGVCPQRQRGAGSQTALSATISLKNDFREPLYLFNNDRRFRLRFDCKNCLMYVLADS